jgi:hypothetical protein
MMVSIAPPRRRPRRLSATDGGTRQGGVLKQMEIACGIINDMVDYQLRS